MQDHLDRLRALTMRHAGGIGVSTAIAGVTISTGREKTSAMPGLYRPMHCLVLQGAKEVMIGDRLLRYDCASYFVASLELPASGRIVQASPDRPYIAASLAPDAEEIAALLSEMPAAARNDGPAFGISPVEPGLLDPWSRLLHLLDTPRDIPVLAPLFRREILYRLLQGPQGGVLRQIALSDNRMAKIRRAIGWIRAHYDHPLRIDTLCEIAGMSAASLHRHFKAATAMSPLQYQKCLRLQQARRLLLTNRDASQAAYAVGYESASQFSREYARLFGASPARDALRLRGDAVQAQEA